MSPKISYDFHLYDHVLNLPYISYMCINKIDRIYYSMKSIIERSVKNTREISKITNDLISWMYVNKILSWIYLFFLIYSSNTDYLSPLNFLLF